MKTICLNEQNPKVKNGDPCSDCGVLIAGGFKFKEPTREGWRCFKCLEIDMNKTKGWQGLSVIFDDLCERKPKLEGRKWKQYALELKKQREDIAQIVCSYRAMKFVTT